MPLRCSEPRQTDEDRGALVERGTWSDVILDRCGRGRPASALLRALAVVARRQQNATEEPDHVFRSTMKYAGELSRKAAPGAEFRIVAYGHAFLADACRT